MKYKILLLMFLAVAVIVSCCPSHQEDGRIKIILETDMGNDVDDALAMDMLHKYIDAGKADVLAVMINKNGEASAEFTDILNTWYGHSDIPLGIVRNGAECEGVHYAQDVCGMKDDSGRPLFRRSMESYSSLPDAHLLYREILASQPDSSVVIVSIGFSTNLARLMDTGADEFSPLTGKALAASKVKLVAAMAGSFENPELCEYNVVKDIPSAKKVFEEWPGEIVVSPFEVGRDILYPAASIENDFGWTEAHPVVEAYKNFLQMPYDRPTWDLTALLYAVEGAGMFSLSPAGKITVAENGSIAFTPDPSGNCRYLITDEEQEAALGDYFVKMISSAPESRKPEN